MTSSVLGGISGFSVYPTVANSRLWLDRNANVYSDTGGTTPASVDGSIGSWRAVGGGWGTDLVGQATGSRQPTLKSNGIQCDGIDDFMSLPSAISLSGAFTAYAVLNFNGAYNHPLTAFSGSTGSFGGTIINYNASGLRVFDDSATYIQTLTASPTGRVLTRIRRDASNNLYFAQTGIAEVARSSTAYTWNIDRLLSYPTVFNNSAARVLQLVLVTADTVTAGTDAAIQSALIALEPGLTGI